MQDSVGEFVGKVREEYELILQDFMDNCTIPNVFQSKQAQEVIQYVRKKYGDDLEFLWDKLPEAAIWRNKENQKWYGILMKVSERKLGINSDKIVDMIDLRCIKGENIVDNQKIFPGYHMNKQSWITIKLDGTMKTKEIFEAIDKSYNINRGSGTWFLPTNPHMFDIISYLDKHKVITWDKALGVLTNDLIYIYVGAPYSSILYKCKVIDVVPNSYTKKKNITMEVLEKYDKEKYPMKLLKEHGLKTVRWAHSMPAELVEFMKNESRIHS
ncbi:MAG: MmcQ/YjbR family DNA-binding protein [Clostridia bacterium]|nr:MmcQ/YjbR family DNA-binding protein [Clostridia bacterium]